MTTGRPSSASTRRAAIMSPTSSLRRQGTPAAATVVLNRSRSSALWMTWAVAPIIRTPYLAKSPLSWAWTARFRAVCPPRVGSRASIFSRSRMAWSISSVMGSM